MALITTTTGRFPYASYYRDNSGRDYLQTSGTIVQTESSVFTDSYTSRKKPAAADLWRMGTGRTWHKWVRHQEGIGRNLQAKVPFAWTSAPLSYWWTGRLGQSLNPSDFPPVDLSGQLRLKIKDQNVNLAQTLAEYRQTADLFSKAANDIYRSFRSLRSGRALKDIARYFKHPRDRIERDIANRWLEYQYGMRPLMQDVYGSAEELAKVLTKGKVMTCEVTRRETLLQRIFPDRVDWVAQGMVGLQEIHRHTRWKAQYVIKDPLQKQLTQIGISNPLNLAWELVPYSFVVDWFLPVGDWLSSLDALNGITDLSHIRVTNVKGQETLWGFGTRAYTTLQRYERTAPITTLSIPRLRWEPSLNLTRVLNGVSLLKQLQPRK